MTLQADTAILRMRDGKIVEHWGGLGGARFDAA
jgi:predicted SnoaL-like aldol condensation-catalyzing enzyme